jgi:hypothetical protein
MHHGDPPNIRRDSEALAVRINATAADYIPYKAGAFGCCSTRNWDAVEMSSNLVEHNSEASL